MGNVNFTVLVEIKTPQTKLCENKKYRNGAFPVSAEVTGAISQLHANCETWTINSTYPANSEYNNDNTKTIQPKGILVIGKLDQLDNGKIKSFELFRRNLFNPEILTFDELLSRAQYIINF